MMKLGRVSKETKGIPVKDDYYEDLRCVLPGNQFHIAPEKCTS